METCEISPIICDCGHPAEPDGFIAGYAVDRDGKKMCLGCATTAELNDAFRNKRAVFYLTHDMKRSSIISNLGHWVSPNGARVTNWTGRIEFRVVYMKVSWHNIARYRIDVWFIDFMGRWWWGRQYGEYSQLCYCRRVKHQP